MPDIYIDTTVVVEALLKTKKRRQIALKRLQADNSIVSVYAFKELKAGPLQIYTWLHNKFVTTRSLKNTYLAIGQILRQQNYRAGTSLEALQVGAEALGLADYEGKKTASQRDRENADIYALAIRRRVLNGWSNRGKIVSSVVGQVECFSQSAPYFDEMNGLVENPKKRCPKSQECGFAKEYKASPEKLVKLISAITGLNRNEDNKRRASLRRLSNTPGRLFEDEDCRNLGDAHFSLTCPPGATILTSNYKDHQTLASALGITVEKFVI
jgi:hypothetical protein